MVPADSYWHVWWSACSIFLSWFFLVIDQIFNFSIIVLSMVQFCPQIVPKVSCPPAVFNNGKALGHLCYVEEFLVMLKDLVHRKHGLYDLSWRWMCKWPFQMKAVCCVLSQGWLDVTWVVNMWKSWVLSDVICEWDVKLGSSDFCMV